MSELARKAAGAAWWSALEIAARYGVQFIVTAIMARLLSPTAFGIIALVIAFTTVASLFVDSGFGTALIQRGDPTPDECATVGAYAMIVAVVMAILLGLLAPPLATFFDEPDLVPLLRASAWVLPLSALGTVPDAQLTVRLAFRARTIAQLLASLIAGGTGIAMAWRGYGPWSLVAQLLIASAVRSFLLLALASQHTSRRGRISVVAFRRLAGFGAYMLLSGIIDTTLTRIQSVLLGRLADVRQVGFYSLAQNAQQAPALFIGSILNRVGLPVFVQIANDQLRIRHAMASALRVSMFCFAPCMLVIAAMARPIVVILYGEAWGSAVPLLSIMALGTLWWPLHVLNLAALSALGRSDLFFRLEIAKAAVVIAMVALAARYGAVAIAAATAVSSFIAIAINTWYAKRLIGYGLANQLRDVAGPLVLGTICALASALVLSVTRGVFMAPGVALAVAVTLYLGAAYVFRLRAGIEFLLLIRRGASPAEATA